MTLDQFRKTKPEYGKLSNSALAGKMHNELYSEMPYKEFLNTIGLQPEPVRVKLPSGATVKFPGDMSIAEINAAIDTEIQRSRPVLEHIRTLKGDSPIIGDRNAMIRALNFLDDPAAVFARDMLEQGLTVDEIHREFQGGYDPIATTASQVARPTLEAGGMAAGELAGAPLGPAASMVGGGLGYAGGRNLADVFDYFLGLPGKPKTAGQELMELPGEVATGTGITMTGPIIGKAGQKMLGPFAGKMSPSESDRIFEPYIEGGITSDARRLAQIAKERKLPLSPSSIFPSKTAKRFEWVAEKVPPGGSMAPLVKIQRGGELAKGFEKMYDDTLKELPVRLPKYDAGEALRGGVKAWEETLTGQKEQAYQVAKGALGYEVNMTKTAKMIEQARAGARGELKYFLDEYHAKGTTWSADDVDTFRSNIWNYTFKKHRQLGGKLHDALKDDIGPEATLLLEKANETNTLLKNFNKIPTVKNMLNEYKTPPENVIWAAFRSGNIEDINYIKSVVDKETWDIARSRFIENLLDTSMTYKEGRRIWKPMDFVVNMEKYGRQIENVMPEIMPALKDFELVAKAAAGDIARHNTSAVDKFLMLAKSTPLMGSSAIFQNPYILVPSGFSYIMARSLTNSPGIVRGVLKKWLTTGMLQGPEAYQAITQGTKALGVAAEE